MISNVTQAIKCEDSVGDGRGRIDNTALELVRQPKGAIPGLAR